MVDGFGDAEAAAGRILAIDDGKVDLPGRDGRRQMRGDRIEPGPADDIADEQDAHGQPRCLRSALWWKMAPMKSRLMRAASSDVMPAGS
jgi:hypothetical protein